MTERFLSARCPISPKRRVSHYERGIYYCDDLYYNENLNSDDER